MGRHEAPDNFVPDTVWAEAQEELRRRCEAFLSGHRIEIVRQERTYVITTEGAVADVQLRPGPGGRWSVEHKWVKA